MAEEVIKTKSSITEKSSRKSDDLPYNLKEILDLLVVNPTLKYCISKLRKDKRIVARDIKRLIDCNFISRIDRGLYKVIKNPLSSNTSHQEKSSKSSDLLRLHNIQIKLRLTDTDFKIIKNKVFSDLQSFRVRNFGTDSYYFDLNITGLITSQNIFIMFPQDFEINGLSIPEVYYKLDCIIRDVMVKWENRFKVSLYKIGRENYELINQHLEIKDTPIAQGMKQETSSQIKVYDSDDGKIALMTDLSKGTPNIESPHSEKAADYIEKAQFLLNTVKDDSYRKMFLDHQDMKLLLMKWDIIAERLVSLPEMPVIPNDQKTIPEYIG